MKSQTPYNDLLSFQKTTSDLKGFVSICINVCTRPLAGFQVVTMCIKTVRENLDRKLVDDFLRRLTPSIDSPAINPNLQGLNVGNIIRL